MSGTTAVLNYKRQAILTAPPVKIVSLLYGAAIRSVSRAESALGDRRFDAAARNIGRAQEIVGELLGALDMEAGGEIARNLQRLYTFALEGMMDANIKREVARLVQVRRVLTTLSEGWDELARS